MHTKNPVRKSQISLPDGIYNSIRVFSYSHLTNAKSVLWTRFLLAGKRRKP